MAINVNIDSPSEGEEPTEQPLPIQATRKLQIRKTLEEDLVITDHRDIDIVVMPKKNKIMAFGKGSYGDDVYSSINRLFNFLTNKGVIELGSERGGNIYSSVEAKIPQNDKHNTTQLVVFTVANWIEEERPYLEWEQHLEDEYEERLTDPSKEESTEFDPERHAQDKGAVKPLLRPYGMYTSYVYE
tara:strand:+ start:588 stop:1145 length:558 start_codon:yes stop_codon:yes gene_type:complete